MSETKNTYHRSLNGAYTQCDATVRSCPRGGHISLSPADVAQAVATGHPDYDQLAGKNRLAADTQPLFLARMEDEYDQLREARVKEAKFNADYEKAVKKYSKENPPQYKTLTLAEVVETQRYQEKTAIKALVDAGVNPTKARYIQSDTPAEGSDAFYPPVKKRDRLDPDIKTKTEAALEALKSNPDYTTSRNRTIEHNLAVKEASARRRDLMGIRAQIASQHGMENTFGGNLADDPAGQKALALAKARQWAANGNFPRTTITASSISTVDPQHVNLDEDGKFTNVWYGRADGSVTRVVGYERNPVATYGEPAAWMVTEDGERLTRNIRYANYTQTVTDPAKGDTRIFIARLQGENLPHPKEERFMVDFSLDSGG